MCRTRFHADDASFRAAGGRVRCGACYGVFDGRAAVVPAADCAGVDAAALDVAAADAGDAAAAAAAGNTASACVVEPASSDAGAGAARAPGAGCVAAGDGVDATMAAVAPARDLGGAPAGAAGGPNGVAASTDACDGAARMHAGADAAADAHAAAAVAGGGDAGRGADGGAACGSAGTGGSGGVHADHAADAAASAAGGADGNAGGSALPSPAGAARAADAASVQPVVAGHGSAPGRAAASPAPMPVAVTAEYGGGPHPDAAATDAGDGGVAAGLATGSPEQPEATWPARRRAVLAAMDDGFAPLTAADRAHLFRLGVDAPAAEQPPRRARGVAAVTLLLLASLALVIYLRAGDWVQDPALRPYCERACAIVGCTLPPYRDPGALHARSIVLRDHPQQAGTWLIDAVLANDAPFPQRFPRLLVEFSARGGAVVATRIFAPEDYLRGELRGVELMQPVRPVQVQLAVPRPPTAITYRLELLP
jgi:predicted Zn finger-like uncharacterized protein